MKYPHNFLIRFVLCFLPPAVFSLLFTQITIYFSYIMLYVYNPIIEGNILSIKDLKFEFVDACIIPYAYYFFWGLCLFTKDIMLKTRIKMVVYGFAMIFAMIAVVCFIPMFFYRMLGMDFAFTAMITGIA